MTETKRVLSLFSGCGGMDLGLEGDFWIHRDCVNEWLHPRWIIEKRDNSVRLAPTGFATVFANDVTPIARNAWIPYFEKRGRKGAFHLDSIVHLVKATERGEFRFPEAIDLLTGGFPCQDFSVSGKRKGFESHKSHTGKLLEETEDKLAENRGKLYYWMKRAIEFTLPKAFIAENVKGLISLSDAKAIIQKDFQAIGENGYLVIPRLLFAPDYGVPQRRERILFVGLNKAFLRPDAVKALEAGEIDIFPAKTHALNPTYPYKPYTTVRSILAGLREPEEEERDLAQKKYSKAKHYGKMQGQVEVDLNGLSPTIRSEHHGNIEFRRLSRELGGKHLEEIDAGLPMRRLTVRECARIQTFPDDYEFVRERLNSPLYPLSGTDGYKLIGNAVPPLLAYHLARHLESIWDRLFR